MNSRYIGAVDCRKMALAAVVSLVDATNKISIDAYAHADTEKRPASIAGAHRETQTTRRKPPATEREQATCQAVRSLYLIATPPVENSTAAATAAVAAARQTSRLRVTKFCTSATLTP